LTDGRQPHRLSSRAKLSKTESPNSKNFVRMQTIHDERYVCKKISTESNINSSTTAYLSYTRRRIRLPLNSNCKCARMRCRQENAPCANRNQNKSDAIPESCKLTLVMAFRSRKMSLLTLVPSNHLANANRMSHETGKLVRWGFIRRCLRARWLETEVLTIPVAQSIDVMVGNCSHKAMQQDVKYWAKTSSSALSAASISVKRCSALCRIWQSGKSIVCRNRQYDFCLF
jgi:hypothetical protein